MAALMLWATVVPPLPSASVMLPRARTVVGSALDPVDRWRGFINEASLRFGVPSEWIVKVMRAESGGHAVRRGAAIRSSKGAMGLMQLMPGTWAAMRDRRRLGANPDDPRDNILAGTAYLRLMYDRFGYPGLFAAYNAGPSRYAAYLRGERAIEHGVLPWCEEHGVAVVAYSPFGHGDFPGPRTAGGQVLEDIAANHGATARQVALRFLVRRPASFAIPKASSVEHAAENAGAGALRLTDAELERIDRAFPLGARPSRLPML